MPRPIFIARRIFVATVLIAVLPSAPSFAVTAKEKAHYITSSLMEAAQWIIEVSSNIPWPKTHEAA